MSRASDSPLGDRIFRVFHSIDRDRSGHITWDELEAACLELSVDLEIDDLESFQSADQDDIVGLNLGEFRTFVLDRLEKAFKSVDRDGSGKLSVDEIHKVIRELGANISRRHVVSLCTAIDKDSDSEIDFEEFCQMFCEVPSPNIRFMVSNYCKGIVADVGSDQIPMALPPPQVPLWQFMFAGGMGGICSRTLTAPLEKLKIIAQTTGSVKIADTFGVLSKNSRSVTRLFAGNLTNVLRVFPTSSVACLVYSRMIKYTPVDNEQNPQQPLWRFISGAVAGITSASLTHPLDVVRSRLTMQELALTHYTGISDTLSKIVKEEGPRALFKGLWPTLVTIAPFMGIQQCTYDLLRLHYMDDSNRNVGQFLLCGAFAGAVAQTVVHPLDVVRRRVMVDRTKVAAFKRTSHASMFHRMKSIAMTGGVRQLYAGLAVSYAKVIPSAAASLIIRDAILGRISS